MSKQNPKRKNRSLATKKAPVASSKLTRRNALKLLIAVPVVGAAGTSIHRYDLQNRGLHDLSAIGAGKPTVIQVHDPSCQLCRRLMKNTRSALKGRDDIAFRVADVTTREGAEFQRTHNAQIVTLITFNAAGKKQDSIQGVTSVNELKERFTRLN